MTILSKILLSIKAIDKKKFNRLRVKREDINFFYRGTNLSEDS